MKTKVWIGIVTLVAAVSLALSLWLFYSGQQASYVKVISRGKVLCVLPLDEDTQISVLSDEGSNIVTVKDGKVAVTQADCPDQHCVNRGFCDRGAQIVCLPNRLVLEFSKDPELDGVSG